MTSPAEMILADARSRGVLIEPNGESIRVIHPLNMPDYTWQGIKADILAHKPAILRVLIDEADRAKFGYPGFVAEHCPAFAFDDSLTVSVADVRRVIEEEAIRNPAPRAHRPIVSLSSPTPKGS